MPLESDLWDMLSSFRLCRTPVQELLHRFDSAEEVSLPETTFALHVNRMLSCLLLSYEDTKDMDFVFVDGRQLDQDASFSGTKWKMHSKWLTYEGTHGRIFCEERDSEDENPYLCDHVVLQLWDIMMSQLAATGNYPGTTAKQPWLLTMARSRLAQMPRSVHCARTDRTGELQVTWYSSDSYLHRDKYVTVTLHADGCPSMNGEGPIPSRDSLLFSDAHGMSCKISSILLTSTNAEDVCDCSIQTSTAVSSGALFEGLDSSKLYTPTVSHTVNRAFVSISSVSLSPLNTMQESEAFQDFLPLFQHRKCPRLSFTMLLN